MRAALTWALGVSLCGCVGPTLDVGRRVLEQSDAGKLDGGPVDGGDARMPFERDAHLDERVPCLSDYDCSENQVRRYCTAAYYLCVECTADRHCPAGDRCDDVYFFCRPGDRTHDSDPTQPMMAP